VNCCETANFLESLLSTLNWHKFFKGKKDFNPKTEPTEKVKKTLKLFKDRLFKLHGDMKHGERKVSFNGFDHAESALLVCTDVAARGLDFKGVKFVL
jgi:ATP-dependent RNA helicase DDX31/DBP7